MDYIFRWLQLRFLSGHQLSLFNMSGAAGATAATMPLPNSVPVEGTIGSLSASSALADPSSTEAAKPAVHVANAMKDLYDMGDAPSCHTCGAIMVRNGSCYRCMSCGSTSGCS
jgi:ribonucleoside-diphosphate reductase alpha chain